MEAEWLPFGILRRPHGTSGEIPLLPFNVGAFQGVVPVPPVRVRLSPAQGFNEAFSEANLVACRPVHVGFLVRFAGIESREAAAALAGQELHMPRAAFCPLEEAEFYVEDIVGCEAFAPDGQRIGRVTGTFWNGAQDVMTIAGDDGSECLLPVVSEYLLQFERAARRLIVDLHE
ncbi:MAG TPA: ribosome maturation factor RimM [Polyangia bacterium]